MKIRKLIYLVSNIGNVDEAHFLDKIKIKVLNQQAFIVLLMCCYYTVAAYGKSDIIIPLVSILATGVIYLLNYYKKWRLSFYYWTLIYPFLVITCSYLYGESIRMDYVFTHFILSVLFFFSESIFKYIAVGIIFISYLLCIYVTVNFQNPYAIEVLWYDKIIIFSTSIICTSNVIVLLTKGFKNYYNENLNKQKKLKKLNYELKTQADYLLKINKHLKKQIHLASHDLKTPLRSIAGFTTLLKKEYSKDKSLASTNKIDEYHEYVQKNIFAMQEIIEEYIENSIEGVQKT